MVPKARSWTVIWVAVCIGLRMIWSGNDVVEAEDKIDNLPYMGEYAITCGGAWHRTCRSGNNDPGAGLDFVMKEGTALYAAADGTISWAKHDGNDEDAKQGYGKYVLMSHPGPDVTKTVYAHMSKYFVSTLAGETACNLVPLGYSGNSGFSTGAHLHFEGNGLTNVPNPMPESWKFTPIYGERPPPGSGSKHTNSDVANGALWDHACSSVGGCAEHTNAFTVDDIQDGSGEFIIGTGWREFEGGFGYFGVAPAETDSDKVAMFMARRYSSDPAHTVRWEPILRETDDDWSIYVFRPDIGSERNFAPALEVKYTVKWWEPIPGGDPKERTADIIVSQEDQEKNEWFRLGDEDDTFPTASVGLPNYRPLTVELTTERQTGSCSAAGSCSGRRVLADAMLFIPSDCD